MSIAKLSKRELAAYILLERYGEIELGAALDLLSNELCMTKKVSRNIVKRLRKLKLLEYYKINNKIILKIKSINDALNEFYSNYRSTRAAKCYALAKRKPRS